MAVLSATRGKFAVSHLALGTYTVEVNSRGLIGRTLSGIHVTESGVAHLDVQLSAYPDCSRSWQDQPAPLWTRRPGALIVGTVTRSRQVSSDVMAQVTNEQSQARITKQLKEGEQFEIDDLSPGAYTVKVTATGLGAVVRKHIQLTENSLTTFRVHMGDGDNNGGMALSVFSRVRKPPVRIKGIITDRSEAIVPDATVRVMKKNATGAILGLGTCDGKIAVYDLPPGVYTTEVISPGFKKWVRNGLNITGNDVINLEPTLDVRTSSGLPVMAVPLDASAVPPTPPRQVRKQIRGRLTDRMGSEMAGASIRLKNKETGEEIIGQSNMDGRFALNDVTFGTYNVEITFPGVRRWVLKNVRVIAGSSSDLKVVMGSSVSKGDSVHIGPLEW